MAGSVRVTSLRPYSEVKPDPDEVEIRVDRSNPALGNRHILRNPRDLRERDKVCDLYARDLEQDFQVQGEKFRAVSQIAERVFAGENVCLACWCAPSRCHADSIAKKVRDLVEQFEIERAPVRRPAMQA